MTDLFYKELILDHYRYPRNFGQLKNPSVVFQKNNPFCGDQLRIELIITKDKVEKIKFSGEGCAISIASASLLTEKVKEQKLADLEKLTAEDILKLLNINLTPTRLKCALLSLEVLQKAINLYKIKSV